MPIAPINHDAPNSPEQVHLRVHDDPRTAIVDQQALSRFLLDHNGPSIDDVLVYFTFADRKYPQAISDYHPFDKELIIRVPSMAGEDETNSAIHYAAQQAIDHAAAPKAYMKEFDRRYVLGIIQRIGGVGLASSLAVSFLDANYLESINAGPETITAAGISASLIGIAHGIYRAGKFERRARRAQKRKEKFIRFGPIGEATEPQEAFPA